MRKKYFILMALWFLVLFSVFNNDPILGFESTEKENYLDKKSSVGKLGVVAPGAKLIKLADGFKYLGAVAADTEGNILFTDMPAKRIYKWSLDRDLSVFLENSDCANGLYFDKKGNLLVCKQGKRQLVSIDPQGKITVLVDKYDGKRFNCPNDLWIDPSGGVYFTDPHYCQSKEQDGEYVFYLSNDYKKLTRVIDYIVRPNGIIGTLDGKLLYVGDPEDGKTYIYSIINDGMLSKGRLFVPMGSDGMTIDSEGNIYLTVGFDVFVYDALGNIIEKINVPEPVTNLCFGGQDRHTLFITGNTSLYSIRMRVEGF
ncbi:MAG: SMP-30/gluconolactonase/LRE family protein [Candidatus Omnitrophota bacterium]